MRRCAFSLALLLAACLSGNPGSSSAPYSEPFRDIARYPFDPSSPLSSRVITATPEIIAYLRAMDKTENYSYGRATDGELALIDGYASDL